MMYSFSVTQQLVVFLQSVGFGIFSGFVHSLTDILPGLFIYDKFRRHIVADIIFSLFFAFSAFCFLLSFNLGKIRFYTVSGVVFGFVIYKMTFGACVDFLTGELLNLLRRLVLHIFGRINFRARRIDEKICKKKP